MSDCRFDELKKERFLTKRVLSKMSENMHYEIFKYLNFKELLEIRYTSLGGYQLTSSEILRSRIKNYYIRDRSVKIGKLIDTENYLKKVKIMCEQMGKELDLRDMSITENDNIHLLEIIKNITDVLSINLGK